MPGRLPTACHKCPTAEGSPPHRTGRPRSDLLVVTLPKSTGSFFGPPTLVELLRHRATRQADDRAFTYLLDGEEQEQHLTYAALDREARRIAARLQQWRAAGERVLLLFPPGFDYIAALFGCLYAGAIAVPAHPPRMNRTLERL